VQQKGCAVDEWSFPTGTLWNEHKHLGGFDLRYASKIDAFQDLVDRIKLGSLSLTSHAGASQQPIRSDHGAASNGTAGSLTGASASSPGTSAPSSQQNLAAHCELSGKRITLIADFPHVHGPDSREQMCSLLVVLAQSAPTPVVVLVTESGVHLSTHLHADACVQ
jgi:hypothetical protein